jgi:hypothetical protein
MTELRVGIAVDDKADRWAAERVLASGREELHPKRETNRCYDGESTKLRVRAAGFFCEGVLCRVSRK